MADQASLLQNISKGISKRVKDLTGNRYSKVNLNWLKIKYLKHLPPGRLHYHKIDGCNFYFKNAQEFLYGLKEIFLEEIYNQPLPQNAYVIDCGAHIGLSVVYIKKICPSAEILAFEPDKSNFALLEKNIKSFELNNVELKQQAVYIQNAPLSFQQDGTMGSKLVQGTMEATVDGVRLKDFVNRKVDFLKLDIEGAEYAVLKDLGDQLSLVNNLFIEYHGTFSQSDELVEIFDLLRQNSFQFYIKEAAVNHAQPFIVQPAPSEYDVQLNIFCFRR